MPTFSKISQARLDTCNSLIQAVCNLAIKEYDFVVLCGNRGEAEQNEAFKKGNSRLKFPKSKHNSLPSMAVDLAPYPVDWTNTKRFKELADVMLRIAKEKDIPLEWGGTCFKGFVDMPHFQLKD